MIKLFDEEIILQVRDKLIEKGQTIAAAESVTAGLLQYSLSTAPDAACFFQGGMTVYNLGQKYRHLHVEPIHASAVNSVSAKVALQMATAICEKYSSDWGVAITGYASPVPESGDRTFAHYCIIHNKEVRAAERIDLETQDPFNIQLRYVNDILSRLARLI